MSAVIGPCYCGHRVSTSSLGLARLTYWSCGACGYEWQAGERFMPHLRHPRLDDALDRISSFLAGALAFMLLGYTTGLAS